MLLMCLPLPDLKMKTNSCWDLYSEPLRNPVIGQRKRTLLYRCEMADDDGWDGGQAELPGSLKTSMPSNDLAIGVHQDRVHKPERGDAGEQLGDLLFGVGSRVARIHLQLDNEPLRDLDQSTGAMRQWTCGSEWAETFRRFGVNAG